MTHISEHLLVGRSYNRLLIWLILMVIIMRVALISQREY